MQVVTERFGAQEVLEKDIIFFTRPLLGFEEWRQYFLLPLPGNPAFTWLQSVEDAELAFLLADPFLFFSGYQIELAPELEQEMGVSEPADVLIYAVVTLPSDPADATANLVAPVILSLKTRRGCQVVLEGTPYQTRHVLFTRSVDQDARQVVAP